MADIDKHRKTSLGFYKLDESKAHKSLNAQKVPTL